MGTPEYSAEKYKYKYKYKITRNKLLAQWVHLTNHAAENSTNVTKKPFSMSGNVGYVHTGSCGKRHLTGLVSDVWTAHDAGQ